MILIVLLLCKCTHCDYFLCLILFLLIFGSDDDRAQLVQEYEEQGISSEEPQHGILFYFFTILLLNFFSPVIPAKQLCQYISFYSCFPKSVVVRSAMLLRRSPLLSAVVASPLP